MTPLSKAIVNVEEGEEILGDKGPESLLTV